MTPPRICRVCGGHLSESSWRKLRDGERKASRDLVVLSVLALVATALAVWFGVDVVRTVVLFEGR